MSHHPSPPDAEAGSPATIHADAHRLTETIHHLSHFLPAQGPIGVFIHHNTLHAFQHKKFEEAVVEAARMFGTEPYMREEAFQASFAAGRIRAEDIDVALQSEPDDEILSGGLRRRELYRKMLVPGLRPVTAETVTWELEEGSLQGGEIRQLIDVCMRSMSSLPAASVQPARPRDGILADQGLDLDDIVHPLLIKLSSAFFDQGLAYWSMPAREHGFFKACLTVLDQPMYLGTIVLKDLSRFVQAAKGRSSADYLLSTLQRFGVKESEWEEVLRHELLALPGWAGLMFRLEEEPGLAPHDRLPASLTDFLAVRMLLTLVAASSVLRDPKDWRSASPTALEEGPAHKLARAAQYAEAAHLVGIQAARLTALPVEQVRQFLQAVDRFPNWERRRIWQWAYERRHERQILLPMIEHVRRPGREVPDRLAAQVFFCIDEREESIRRHLEEVDPEIETLSAAGFFGVAMNYAGIDDAHGVALCPVVVKPAHAVREQPSAGHEDLYEKRKRLRRQWAMLVRNWWISSRTFVRGWLGTTVLGLFSIVPLAARVFSPRRYSRLIFWLNDSILPEPRTELAFTRAGEANDAIVDGLLSGFTTQEKVDRVAGLLGPAGLRKGMARLVVFLGHGSTSLNNPHESAHDCGACGGSRGGPNGRIFAAMANRPEVRSGLRERDIVIPDDTWFVGGYHDTCNDDVDLYDLEVVPESHRGDLARVRASLDNARARSAHERARRFEAAAWGISAEQGLHHVQGRAEHLAEPRPEYGHCTNAVCIVGRRSTTRGLFLDRRAFLNSYDATQDPDNDSLARILGAVIPVCGGISLEYYFSFVDNEGYGCGTKLPHNVTGLMGVMNGYEGDLRTGLPWQMVEIHEPVRILFVVETTPDRVLQTIHKSPLLWEFLDNRWIRLAAMDPIDGTVYAYRGGPPGEAIWERIEGTDEPLPEAPTSVAWYEGHREHLPLARITKAKSSNGKLTNTKEMVGV
ncbi:MAG: DUF2309 domain-containing protein [Acidobacteriota bacterium]